MRNQKNTPFQKRWHQTSKESIGKTKKTDQQSKKALRNLKNQTISTDMASKIKKQMENQTNLKNQIFSTDSLWHRP